MMIVFHHQLDCTSIGMRPFLTIVRAKPTGAKKVVIGARTIQAIFEERFLMASIAQQMASVNNVAS